MNELLLSLLAIDLGGIPARPFAILAPVVEGQDGGVVQSDAVYLATIKGSAPRPFYLDLRAS